MSSEPPVISVHNLAKHYRISHQAQGKAAPGNDTLAETLFGWAKRAASRPKREEFWAVKDVSFDVHEGEVLGIIGRNGAGKSTLLKLLSRITRPSRGHFELRGRIGSLLEVGTGFHPELTGRENIFLNGAILGMTRREVKDKFDEIVAFSGVERFLDTPVKRYSSGMYVRLAFGVAAHLDPEILIVDEVLAVGDAEFQRKCLGKMREVAGGGRTVLFVSHNLNAVSVLCDRCLWLDAGRVRADGPTQGVLRQYADSATADEAAEVEPDADPHKPAQITRVGVYDEAGRATLAHDVADAIRLRIEFVVREPQPDLVVLARLYDALGHVAFVTSEVDADAADRCRAPGPNPREAGEYAAEFEFPAVFLNAGRHEVSLALVAPRRANLDEFLGLRLDVGDLNGVTTGLFMKPRNGAIVAPLRWNVRALAAEAVA